jgi:hypothetical protein
MTASHGELAGRTTLSRPNFMTIEPDGDCEPDERGPLILPFCRIGDGGD